MTYRVFGYAGSLANRQPWVPLRPDQVAAYRAQCQRERAQDRQAQYDRIFTAMASLAALKAGRPVKSARRRQADVDTAFALAAARLGAEAWQTAIYNSIASRRARGY